MQHRAVDPGDHKPGPWGRLSPSEEAQHGCKVWRRDCTEGTCQWAQCTTVDPADPQHPDAHLVRPG